MTFNNARACRSTRNQAFVWLFKSDENVSMSLCGHSFSASLIDIINNVTFSKGWQKYIYKLKERSWQENGMGNFVISGVEGSQDPAAMKLDILTQRCGLNYFWLTQNHDNNIQHFRHFIFQLQWGCRWVTWPGQPKHELTICLRCFGCPPMYLKSGMPSGGWGPAPKRAASTAQRKEFNLKLKYWYCNTNITP